jgi:nickel/cobalt transporter (NiCoT) family protein
MWIGLLFDDSPEAQGTKLASLCLVLGVLNLAAWIWALAEFSNQPALLGTAFLAYVFGLRHAVDADHIAAIDNVVRKLMQEGKRPLTAGFFFSLGHSTVVVIATIAVAVTAVTLERQFGAFKSVGGIIGTSVSAVFLLVIGFINLMVLVRVWRTFQKVRAGGKLEAEHLESLLAGRGFLARLFRGDLKKLANVSAGISVWFGLRYGNRNRSAEHFCNTSCAWHVALVDADLSRAVHSRDDACRYGRWGIHGQGLRMGVR